MRTLASSTATLHMPEGNSNPGLKTQKEKDFQPRIIYSNRLSPPNSGWSWGKDKDAADKQDPRELYLLCTPLRKLLEDGFQHNEKVNQKRGIQERRIQETKERQRRCPDIRRGKSLDGPGNNSRLEQEVRVMWDRCPQTSKNTERLGLWMYLSIFRGSFISAKEFEGNIHKCYTEN